MSGASLFHEAATPKRLRDDFDAAPTQERMGPQRVPRRNPSTDQKKARTQMARQSTQENTMAQYTEAEYLQRIASAPTLVEQQRLSAELAAFRQQRAATLRSEAAYGSIREASARVAAAAPPAFTRHSIASDWLGEAAEVGDTRTIEATMRAEASLWWDGRPDAVKANPDEIRAQAHGFAARTASQHGLAAPGARAAFLGQVEHLSKVAMDEVQKAPFGVPSGSSLPEGVDNKDTFDDSLLTAPGGQDPQTEPGDSASLKEGDSPEGDASQGIENPAADATHDTVKSTEYTDPNPSGGTGGKSAARKVAEDTNLGWNDDDCPKCGAGVPATGESKCRYCGADISAQQQMKKDKADGGKMYEGARKTASISLTNVGIVDKAGLVCKGKDASGNEVKFKVTQSEMNQLAAVLYGDLALNFSGVTIEESDVIRSEGSRKVADDQTSTEADGAVPSLSEGDSPEGDHAEPGVLPAKGTGHDAGPGNDAAVDSIDGTPYPKQASLRAIAASITPTEASAPFVSALATLASVEGSVAGIPGRDIVGYVLRSANLDEGQRTALEAHLSGVVRPFSREAGEVPPEFKEHQKGKKDDDGDDRAEPKTNAERADENPFEKDPGDQQDDWYKDSSRKTAADGDQTFECWGKTWTFEEASKRLIALQEESKKWGFSDDRIVEGRTLSRALEEAQQKVRRVDTSSDTTPSSDSDAGDGGGFRPLGGRATAASKCPNPKCGKNTMETTDDGDLVVKKCSACGTTRSKRRVAALTLDPTFASRLKTALPDNA